MCGGIMVIEPDAPKNIRVIRLAVLAMAFETWCVLALSAMHFLRPDLAPTRHMVSEYALGRYGWVMTSAFAAMALGCLMLLLGLLREGPAVWTARAAEAL